MAAVLYAVSILWFCIYYVGSRWLFFFYNPTARELVCPGHPVLFAIFCWYAVVFGLIALVMRPSLPRGLVFLTLVLLDPLLQTGCWVATGELGTMPGYGGYSG
ncbi:hypothetical protein [Phenylobacterium sp.]|uniref:hypothetical protein n=1 Tax=Phenylobacterium sp. TaxID=1871053 RepID=UPI00301DC713